MQNALSSNIGGSLRGSKRRLATAVLAAGLMLGTAAPLPLSPAHAKPSEELVSLVWPHSTSEKLGTMPRLRDTASSAARHINAALNAADHRLRGAVIDCAAQAHDDGASGSDYDRTVTVAMAGPKFLSLVVSDSAFCGGIHPNFQTVAFTFDLATGRTVDWVKLLPAPLIEATTTEGAMDGATMGLVRSKLLVKLDTDPSEGCGMPEDAAFQLWPDAKERGIYFAWADPPYANENCGEPALLDVETLRRYGASPVLIQALTRARPR